jgi:hypothetical protein
VSAGGGGPAGTRSPRNPYIGPYPFALGQRLPNREREARELADLLIAEQVVLLHAPSGAGKTSLIQAAVTPLLVEDGFRVTPPVRVDKPVPVDNGRGTRKVHNRYVYSLALYLLGDGVADPRELEPLDLSEVLDLAGIPSAGEDRPPVLVIDQLEEALTLDPTDWQTQQQFFRELGGVLASGGIWALLAMREDYMGGLARCLRLIPGHLRTRYRLDFLDPGEALAAIQKPAAGQGVTVTDEAAHALVDKLALAKVQSPEREAQWRPAPYVEPFQLQVVCRQLWKDVRHAKGDFLAIEEADVEAHVDVERALSRYYSRSVAELVDRFGVDAGAIRDWFEHNLITEQGFRSQTTTGPVTGAGAAEVLGRLSEMFLINCDTRGTTTWYELAHDRLIPAVLDNNNEWRKEFLEYWQLAAAEWLHRNRPKRLLLSAENLRHLPPPTAQGLADHEREYLGASHDEAGNRFLLRGYRNSVVLLVSIALAEALIIILLLIR